MRTRVLPAILALALSMTGGAALARAGADASQAEATFETILREAQGGDAARYVDLAKLYLDGEGVTRDVPQALAWLRKGVAGGDTDAMVELGNVYFDGTDSVPVDRRAALKLYGEAARRVIRTACTMSASSTRAAAAFPRTRAWPSPGT